MLIISSIKSQINLIRSNGKKAVHHIIPQYMNSDLKAYKSNTQTKCTGTNSVLELERASSSNEAFNSPTST